MFHRPVLMVWTRLEVKSDALKSFRGRDKGKESEVHLLEKGIPDGFYKTPQQMVQSDVKFPRKY